MKLIETKFGNSGQIHETAVVHPNAKIGRNVTIGPYVVIGEHVTLGDNCKLGPRVMIDGWTTIGESNHFHHGATIGIEPQDQIFPAEKSSLTIGDFNIFREFVTVSRGTPQGGGETRIGDRNLLQAYSHIAHNCQIGNHVIIGNCNSLGDRVQIEDRAIISGLSVILSSIKIGTLVMIGACTKIVKDIPPYVLVDGNPSEVFGINVVGLRRNGLESDVRDEIKRAYKILYRSNLTLDAAINKMEQEFDRHPEISQLIKFLRSVENGILR